MNIRKYYLQFIESAQDRSIISKLCAAANIKEDKLRIMRCYRFAKQLGFTIEAKALKACRRHFDDMVKEVSSMRIMNEVEKMVGL